MLLFGIKNWKNVFHFKIIFLSVYLFKFQTNKLQKANQNINDVNIRSYFNNLLKMQVHEEKQTVLGFAIDYR